MADRDLTGTDSADSPDTHIAHCSACDRPVRVRVQPGLSDHDRPTAHDISHLICLDKGDDCTGALCPFEEVTPDDASEATAIPDADPDSATG